MTVPVAKASGLLKWARAVALALLISGLMAQGSAVFAAERSAYDVLLDQARENIAAGRADLALDAVDRALSAKPEDAEALLIAVVANAATEREAEAKAAFDRLIASHPNDADRIARAKQAIAEKGRSGLGGDGVALGKAANGALASARAAAKAGAYEKAVALYRDALGPDPANAPAALQLEFFETLAGDPSGIAEAVAGLRRLARNGSDARARLALARVLTYQPETRREGIDALAEFSQEAGDGPARASWRQALVWLAPAATDMTRYEAYLARFPDDAIVKRARSKAVRDLQAKARGGRPDPSATARRRGFRHLEAGRIDAARAEFDRALARNRNDRDALGGLGLVFLKEERFAEAESALARAGEGSPRRQARWAEALASARFWRGYREATAAYEAGDTARAARLARALTAGDGGDALLAWRLLGDALLAGDRPAAAAVAYRGALRLAPGDPAAERGVYNALIAEGRFDDARAFAASMSPAAQAEAATPLAAEAFRAEADAAAAAGDMATADARYRDALNLAPDDPWTRLAFARFLAVNGQAASGDDLMRPLLEAPRPSAEMAYAAGLYFERLGLIEDAASAAGRIPPEDATPEMQAFARRVGLRSAVAAARAGAPEAAVDPGLAILARNAESGGVTAQLLYADALSASRDYEGAGDVLRRVAANPDLPASERRAYGEVRARVIAGQADGLRDIGAHRAAYDHLAPGLAMSPGDPDLLAALARIYVDVGQDADARTVYDRLLAARPNDLGLLRAAAGAAIRAGDQERADALLARARMEHPTSPEVYVLAGDAARARGDRAAAKAAFSEARVLAEDAPERATITAELDRRERDMRPRVRHGFEARAGGRIRDGDDGLDRLREANGALVYRHDREDFGRLTLSATPVHLSAGKLDPGEANLRRFGANPLSPTGAVADPGKIDASGVGLSLGYGNEHVQADIGVTPLGFREVNPVGGVTGTFMAAPNLKLALTAEQRAMTDSVLSYAGLRDPATGATFGGVVRRGVRGQASYDLGAYGFYAAAGYYALVGRNVEDNSRIEGDIGGYRRLINRPDETLTLGGNLTLFAYDRNLRHFTLGHGGYFSPQRFASLSAPVDYMREQGPLTYRLGAAVGVTHFKEVDAAVFPGDGARTTLLFDRLTAGDLGATALTVHPGQSETGIGFNAKGAVEYALTDRTRVGVGGRIDWNPDWYEAAAAVFLRHSLGDEPR